VTAVTAGPAEPAPSPEPPRPRRTPTSAPFWDGLDAGEVRLQRCGRCGAWVHYPRNRCPECLADALGWHTVSGHGRIHTFTVARQPVHPLFGDGRFELLAVVELDEGVRVTTTLRDVDAADVRVGLPVVPVFERGDDGQTLLHYRPEG
jgi:uncharacterized OB-fold protein